MPTTQRPFFASFLAAFRAHSAIQGKASTSSTASTTTSSSTSTTQTSASTSLPSQPRTITTKAGPTTAALSTLHSPRGHSSSTSPAHHTHANGVNSSTSPTPHTSSAAYTEHPSRYLSSPRGRRGSDSSSEGFRDVLGAEKWYIGGRTATGEERYFKLGVVRRQRSVDRLSMDRLSL